jgi:hypothetical protein
MCQPSWGFVLGQLPAIDPVHLWHNKDRIYPRAFCDISRKFHFDGVLIPAVGLAPLDEGKVRSFNSDFPEGPHIVFASGDSCTYCHDDLPRYYYRQSPEADIESFNPETIPEKLIYHPPSRHLRMYLKEDAAGRVSEIIQTRQYTGNGMSVHGSMYSPEDYLIDLLGADKAMMALLTHPDKCKEILMRFAHAVAGHVQEQIDAGVDAMNLSAPWTGQNFISPQLYEEIIAPAQKVLADLCRKNDVICYCHTCGAIDDRLELIIDIGFHGIECLDPPPLGNVELEDAVRRIGHRAFIKGNIDPVNILRNGTVEEVRKDVLHRLETGMRAKGFILSTACSIAPGTPPENIDVLYEVVRKYGYY